MDHARKPWLRGAIALGVMGVMTASLVVSPASAHLGKFNHLKKHMKKIANQRINALVPGMAIEETELVRYGPIKLNVGGSQAIGTFGPFAFTAVCDDDPTSADDVRARVRITTSEDNTAFASDDDSDDDFDVAENGDTTEEENWHTFSGLLADPQDIAGNEDVGHAQSPSGTAVFGTTSSVHQFGGSNCVISGWLLVAAPQ